MKLVPSQRTLCSQDCGVDRWWFLSERMARQASCECRTDVLSQRKPSSVWRASRTLKVLLSQRKPSLFGVRRGR